MAKKSIINHDNVRKLLLSPEVEKALLEAGKAMTGGDSRYTVEPGTNNTERASVIIKDESRDAIRHEIRTGRLGRIAKGNR
jgi:hypothetical protein